MNTLEMMVREVIVQMDKVAIEMRAKASVKQSIDGAQAYAEGVAVTAEHTVQQLQFALKLSAGLGSSSR